MTAVKYLRYCRVCANKKDLSLLLPLVDNGKELCDITHKIAAVHIQFSTDDKLPQEICHICLPRVEMAYTFITTCERAQKKLIQMAHSGCTNFKDTIQIVEDKNKCTFNNKELKDAKSSSAFSNQRTHPSDLTHDVDMKTKGGQYEIDDDRDLHNVSSEEKKNVAEGEKNDQPTSSKKSKKLVHCADCGKRFETRSGLTFHIQSVHSKNIFICELCGKSFRHKTNLTAHKTTHLPDEVKKLHACIACNKRFRSKFLLKEHLNVHYDLRPHSCSICDKSFHKSMHLKNHMTRHLECQVYQCDLCGKQLSRRHNLISHIRRHEKLGKISCRICGEEFHTNAQLRRHGTTVHTQEDLGNRLRKDDKNVAECPICHKFLSRLTLRVHVKAHDVESPLHCEVCGKGLRGQTALAYHLKAFHSTDGRSWKCQYCNEAFMTRDLCTRHEYKHTGDAPFKCSECAKSFRSQSSLRQHRLVHQGTSERHECHVCHKQFKRRGTLNVHLRIHTGDLPFQCNFCEKKFAQKNDMFKHQTAIHWRKMRCGKCSIMFTSQEQLKQHRAECPNVCKELKPVETRMEKSVDQPVCNISSIVLEHNTDIVASMEEHQGVSQVQYLCTACNVTFDTEQRLENHFQGFHGQSSVEASVETTYHLEYALK